MDKLEFFNVQNYKGKCCPLEWGPNNTLVFGISKLLKFYHVGQSKKVVEVSLPHPCSNILWLQNTDQILAVMNKKVGETQVHGKIALIIFNSNKAYLQSVYSEGHKIEILCLKYLPREQKLITLGSDQIVTLHKHILPKFK